MQHYKHDLSNKYKDSIKAAALFTKGAKQIQTKFFYSNLLMPLRYLKLNITLIIWGFYLVLRDCHIM